MQVSEKGDFDWALASCAAVGQKTGTLDPGRDARS
jgi:hypothetical protein